MRRIVRKVVLGCLPIIGLFYGVAADANVVVNGGFETGSFSSWTQSGDTSFSGVFDAGTAIVHTGTYAASFGTSTARTASTISQVLATTSGTLYTLTFWLAVESDALGVTVPNSFSTSWGGIVTTQNNLAASGPKLFTVSNLMATSPMTTLSFSFTDLPAFFDLDDVAVNAVTTAAVPEPDSLALLALAGGLMVMRRRRR